MTEQSPSKSRDEIIQAARNIGADLDVSHPGRFDGASDDELTAACEAIVQNGGADADAGNVDEYGFHYALVGAFIYSVDSQGFRDVEAFDTHADAEAAFERLGEELNADAAESAYFRSDGR